MSKTIVITLPHFFDGEAGQIVQLLQGSVDLVHIRKPQASVEEIEHLIREIPSEHHHRLVLHDHHSLAMKYHLYGIHLNSRNPFPPEGWRGSVSRSCHSLEEVMEWKQRCDYMSLSPVFDSISKQGYHAAFSAQQLTQAREQGIIDEKVMALGGVTFNRMDEVLRMGFGGGMILGDAWGKESQQTVCLTIAGSDPSAGAGIQQDLRTMTVQGVYGATVITAVTTQNTLGVSSSLTLPAEVVASQLETVLSDLRVTAVKIGMIPNDAIAHAVALKLANYKHQHPCAIVYDPVMVSTSGKRLMEESCIYTVERELFPLCTLVTPNLPEAECLLGKGVPGSDNGSCGGSLSAAEAARKLAIRYHTAFLVKGGHTRHEEQSTNRCTDYLSLPDGSTTVYESPMIATHNLHGTGCTLSSAIASYLMKGKSLEESVALAKRLVTSAIAKGANRQIGRGNGPLWVMGK